jgi:acyl carrier protein
MQLRQSAEIARREEVLTGIRQILIDVLRVERGHDEIDPDTPLFGTGLGLDSVDAVDLWVNISAKFGIKALANPLAWRSAMRTLNKLADLVLEQSCEAPHEP